MKNSMASSKNGAKLLAEATVPKITVITRKVRKLCTYDSSLYPILSPSLPPSLPPFLHYSSPLPFFPLPDPSSILLPPTPKAYGGVCDVMSFRRDMNYAAAWPTAEIAVMGAKVQSFNRGFVHRMGGSSCRIGGIIPACLHTCISGQFHAYMYICKCKWAFILVGSTRDLYFIIHFFWLYL